MQLQQQATKIPIMARVATPPHTATMMVRVWVDIPVAALSAGATGAAGAAVGDISVVMVAADVMLYVGRVAVRAALSAVGVIVARTASALEGVDI